jgi:hypothetical protein
MYFSGNTAIAVNVAGLQFPLDFNNGTMYLLENQSGIPIYYVDFEDGFGYLSSIAQPISCYTYNLLSTPITPTPTPSNTVTPTVTPTMTPTPSPTGGLPPGVIQFLVASGSTQGGACSQNPSFYVYAQDLGNCGGCLPLTCWACLNTSQQLFTNPGLTIPVGDAYYKNEIEPGSNATWYVVGGYPQGGGFMSC